MILLQVFLYTCVVFTCGYIVGFRIANLRTLRRLQEMRPWL